MLLASGRVDFCIIRWTCLFNENSIHDGRAPNVMVAELADYLSIVDLYCTANGYLGTAGDEIPNGWV